MTLVMRDGWSSLFSGREPRAALTRRAAGLLCHAALVRGQGRARSARAGDRASLGTLERRSAAATTCCRWSRSSCRRAGDAALLPAAGTLRGTRRRAAGWPLTALHARQGAPRRRRSALSTMRHAGRASCWPLIDAMRKGDATWPAPTARSASRRPRRLADGRPGASAGRAPARRRAEQQLGASSTTRRCSRSTAGCSPGEHPEIEMGALPDRVARLRQHAAAARHHRADRNATATRARARRHVRLRAQPGRRLVVHHRVSRPRSSTSSAWSRRRRGRRSSRSEPARRLSWAWSRQLGVRTAEMHRAFADRRPTIPHFAPEPITRRDLAGWVRGDARSWPNAAVRRS